MSAPISPGGVTSPSDTASVNTAISKRAVPVRLVGGGAKVAQVAEEVRRLHDDAGHRVVDRGEKVLGRADVRRQRDDLVAGHARERAHDLGILRVQPARQHGLAALRHAMRHQHRLAGAGRAVIHRGVRDLHGGEVRDLGLELEQILQRALRDLGLIGRVARQELGALDEVVDASPARGACRRRRRRRTAPRRRRRSSPPSARGCARPRARPCGAGGRAAPRGACPRARRRRGRRCRPRRCGPASRRGPRQRGAGSAFRDVPQAWTGRPATTTSLFTEFAMKHSSCER